ncbi:MAG TPA: hypothetical protein PLZ12_13815 [Saprospiraceae bacterium]|nr:hypothetical protein [Saprospiraceae bacterium]
MYRLAIAASVIKPKPLVEILNMVARHNTFKMDERTKDIIKYFSDSRNETAVFYDDYPGFERLKPIRQFIATLQQNGEGGFFRFGISVHMLIISRSVNKGLRPDQKFIIINAYDCKFEVTFRDGYKVYRQYMVDTLDDTRVTKLLRTRHLKTY